MKTSSTKLMFGLMLTMFSALANTLIFTIDDLQSMDYATLQIGGLLLLFAGAELLHSYFKNMLKDYGEK